MAVVQVTTATVKPDRFEDYLDQMRKAKALVEKHGGKNVRLLAALVAGEATGSMAIIAEIDDWTAYGAGVETLYADPEVQALMATANTTASPTVANQTTLWVDVPL